MGWAYFVDKNGDVARSLLPLRHNSSNEVIVKTGIIKEKDYCYYIDDEGDVSRFKLYRKSDPEEKLLLTEDKDPFVIF